MPKAYVIFTEAIHDPEGLRAYEQAAMPSVLESGARVLAVDAGETLEGNWRGDRTVVLEFDSVEAARAWYDSESYAAARPLRQAATDSDVVLLTGLG